jgi:heparinase II/III-like protein
MPSGRLGSFRGRSPAELAERARQAVSRALERRGFGDVGVPDDTALSKLVDPASFGADRVIQGPFFASLDDREATLGALRRVDARFDESLRERADRVMRGAFDLLGFRELSFGQPIDWWLDPVAGVRAPAGHWSRIDYLDPSLAGDHKVVWELSRHHALLTLAQAWWCTHDTRYRDALSGLLESWLVANPPKVGIHWASSLEVSFRGIAWLWILALAGDSLPPPLVRRMVGFLAISARHVNQYLSRWFSPNTHLTGEALGLFMTGTALPQCRDAPQWRATGASLLLDWIDRHVRRDGTYVEQSTWYHRYTTDFYLQFLALSDRAGTPVRDRVSQPLAKLLEHLQWIARPDGSMPLIGDDDGGRLLFLDERTAHDVRTPLAIGAVLLDRERLAFGAPPSAELVWLLGAGALDRLSHMQAKPPATRRAAFPDGGTYVMRSGWDHDASVMTIDAGPHGFLNGGHAHADALSIDLCLGGKAVFVDPGTYTYTLSPEWRDYFRLTGAHNAVVVDGCGAAIPSGAFQWSSRATSRCLVWHDSGSVALFAGTHDGFERLRPPVRYQRTVVFVEPDLWIVRDQVYADDEHEVAVHWQCATGLTAHEESGGIVVRAAGEPLATMKVAEPDGRWSVEEGWVSPTYGVRVSAPRLRFVRRSKGPMAITTVIASGSPTLRVACGDGDGRICPVEVTWGKRQGTVLTGTGEPHGREADAAITWIEQFADGSPARVITAGK